MILFNPFLKTLFAITTLCFCAGCNGNPNRSQSYKGKGTSDFKWEESDTSLRLIDGKIGLTIFQHPDFTRQSTRWYITNNPEVPFIYYSPAVIFDHNILLKKEQQLHLKYRVWIISGDVDENSLKEKYDQYVSK